MMRRALAGAILAVLLAMPATAQDEEPTTAFDTYCLTVDVPAGTLVDESTILDDISILTVVALVTCPTDAEPDDGSTVFPAGTEVAVDQWTVKVEGANNSAWKRIRRENQFNDSPPRGTRLVLLTVRVGHDERGSSYDPAFELEYSLFGPDDAMEEYSGVLPGKSFHSLDGIPGGRSKTFTEAFVVPNRVKLKDLVLYVEGDTEFAEVQLAD